MKKFKKFAAACLAAAMTCASITAYADEVIETAAEPQTLEVYCPGANNDPDFPFNFDIEVDPGSISYIDLDEPIYGFEQLLDREALDFDVKFSLKDEYKDSDHYEFQVLDADYTEEIASGYFESDEVFTIPGLSIGTTYKISITLESEPLTAYYGGQFTIQAELDSTLAVDLFYQLAAMEGEAAFYDVSDKENDRTNNYENTPDTLRNNTPMTGSSTTTDIDYFKFTTDNNNSKVAKVVISLAAPAGGGRRMEITNSDINFHKVIDTGIGKTQYITAFNVPWNSSFKIKVTHSGGSESGSYTLLVNSEPTLAWYGQYISKYDGGEFWNTNKLDKVYNGGFPVFVESNDQSNDDLFATGCGVAAAAMIFRNMGATMDGYDLRTGYDGTLQADPYTALLANIEDDGRDWANANYLPFVGNPESFNEKIGIKFKFKEKMDSIDIDESELRTALAKNGYVLVYFNKGDAYRCHFMILIGLEPEGSTLAEKAIVYDPAGMSYAEGAGANGKGIKLTETAWYKRNKNYFKFSSARVFVK